MHSVPHRLVCKGLRVRQEKTQSKTAVRTLPAIMPSAPRGPGAKAPLASPWTVDERLVLEILARRHACEHTATARETIQAGAPFYEAAADANTDDEVASLEFQVPANGWATSAKHREWCDAIRKAVHACPWGDSVPVNELSDEALCALRSRIELNSFDGLVRDVAPAASMGVGVYLGGVTMLNHSCEPNCALRHRVPALTVTTTRRVRKGESLTISYIDLIAHSTRDARRVRLRAQYGFDCFCSACDLASSKVPVRASRAIKVLRQPAACTCCIS